MLTEAPKGTKDIYGAYMDEWQRVEAVMRGICDDFGIGELRTPMFEHTELFLRGVGETTDIVQKEMYTFKDKGDRSVTLRPEGTAGAARSYIEHGIYNNPQPTRYYYIGPCSDMKIRRRADRDSSTSLAWKCWDHTAPPLTLRSFPWPPSF